MIYFCDSNDIICGKFIFLGKILKFIMMEKSRCLWDPLQNKATGRRGTADFTVMMMSQWTCCKNFWANIVSAAFITHLVHKTGSKCFQAPSEWKPSLMNKDFSIGGNSQKNVLQDLQVVAEPDFQSIFINGNITGRIVYGII